MTMRHLVRFALLVLTAAAFYNMFSERGLRQTRAATVIFGELPRCEPASKR